MSQFAPTSVWRVVLPAIATTVAVILLLLSFIGFRFHQRLDGYVQVEGTVQTAVSGADVGLDVTALEVKYEIDGNPHVGIMASSEVDVDEGDTLQVMAPEDGSPFSLLRLPASGATVTFGWLSFLIGLGATIAGTVWLVRASLGRNRALRAQTWSVRPPGPPIAPPGYPPPPVPPPPSTPPGAWPGSWPGAWPLDSHGPGLSAPGSYDAAAPPNEPTHAPTSELTSEPTRPDRPPPTRGP